MTGWIVRWRTLEERFASAWEALDRWERLDRGLGLEPELFEVAANAAVRRCPGPLAAASTRSATGG